MLRVILPLMAGKVVAPSVTAETARAPARVIRQFVRKVREGIEDFYKTNVARFHIPGFGDLHPADCTAVGDAASVSQVLTPDSGPRACWISSVPHGRRGRPACHLERAKSVACV